MEVAERASENFLPSDALAGEMKKKFFSLYFEVFWSAKALVQPFDHFCGNSD